MIIGSSYLVTSNTLHLQKHMRELKIMQILKFFPSSRTMSAPYKIVNQAIY